jgi:hypothetical protein
MTPSPSVAASASEMTRVCDVGIPTEYFFWSNDTSPSVGQSLTKCPVCSHRLQM